MSKVIVPKVPADPHKIRKLIRDKNLLQSSVGRDAGIDKATFSKQLNGYRPIDLVDLVRVASVLGVEWDSLLVDPCAGCGGVHCAKSHNGVAA